MEMNEPKAIVSTILLAIVMAIALTGARFVSDDELGLNLYNLLMIAFGYLWLADRLRDFFIWMLKGD